MSNIERIYESFVMKKADDSKIRIVNSWKKRYLCLTSESLAYGSTAEDTYDETKRKGCVKLSGTMECEKGRETYAFNVFDVSDGKRTLVLRLKALSEQEFETWLIKISDAIRATQVDNSSAISSDISSSKVLDGKVVDEVVFL